MKAEDAGHAVAALAPSSFISHCSSLLPPLLRLLRLLRLPRFLLLHPRGFPVAAAGLSVSVGLHGAGDLVAVELALERLGGFLAVDVAGDFEGDLAVLDRAV